MARLPADQLPAEIVRDTTARPLAAAEFHRLADVPSEAERFANLSNPCTPRAHQSAIADYTRFTGIARPGDFRTVTQPT